MVRCLIKIAAITVLLAATAGAQVIPGDSPSSGIGSAVANSRGSVRGILRLHGPEGASTAYEGEQQYRETLKKIPNRKTSSDPWRTIRQTPTASTLNRHRAE